jgi:hypothetical protein
MVGTTQNIKQLEKLQNRPETQKKCVQLHSSVSSDLDGHVYSDAFFRASRYIEHL